MGVDKFKTSGDAAVVANLAREKTLQDIHLLQSNHISKNSEKEFEIEAIRNIKEIVFSLKNYTDAVAVCHVKTALSEIDCIKENWKKIKDLELDVWLEENPEYQILFDTIKSLEEDFKDFSDDKDYNRIPLIEWCFKHQLVQQAVTIARETVVIYLVRLINKKEPRISERIRLGKEDVAKALGAYRIHLEHGRGSIDESYKKNFFPLFKEFFLEGFYREYFKLMDIRNQINHANDRKPVGDIYRNVEDVLKQILNFLRNVSCQNC